MSSSAGPTAPHLLWTTPTSPCSVLEERTRPHPSPPHSSPRLPTYFCPRSLRVSSPRTPHTADHEPPHLDVTTLCGQPVLTFLCSPRLEFSPSPSSDILAQQHVLSPGTTSLRDDHRHRRHPRYAQRPHRAPRVRRRRRVRSLPGWGSLKSGFTHTAHTPFHVHPETTATCPGGLTPQPSRHGG